MIDHERLEAEMKSWKCPKCSLKMDAKPNSEGVWPSANSFIKCQCGWSGMVWEVALDCVRSNLAVVLRQVSMALDLAKPVGLDAETVITPLVRMFEARPDLKELMEQLEE